MGMFERLLKSFIKEMVRSSTSTQSGRRGRRGAYPARMQSRLAEIISQSLEIARESQNIDTKLSRLAVAKEKYERLCEVGDSSSSQDMIGNFGRRIEELERDFESRGLFEIARKNAAAQELEKLGNTADAIEVYELLAQGGADTPFTYRRLAILYRKTRQTEKEKQALQRALANVPSTNTVHWEWFRDRLEKLGGA